MQQPVTPLSSAALLQQRLWSADPEAWSLYSEPHTAPLFLAALDAAAVAPGTRLLDVGCGTGLLLELAAARGATVTGLDVSPGMLEVAAHRVPSATLTLGDLQRLPYDDDSFDVVTGINAFAFAEDPRVAIAEAARVCVDGGRVVAGMFAAPERSESTRVHEAMSRLSPPQRETDHEPYQLSAPGRLEAAFEEAGLEQIAAGEVLLDWHYEELEHALRGLATSGGGTRAVEDAGLDAVRATLREALQQFTDPVTGEVTMHNAFRWLAAVTRSAA